MHTVCANAVILTFVLPILPKALCVLVTVEGPGSNGGFQSQHRSFQYSY